MGMRFTGHVDSTERLNFVRFAGLNSADSSMANSYCSSNQYASLYVFASPINR